jgi:signal transduction histidine kinase
MEAFISIIILILMTFLGMYVFLANRKNNTSDRPFSFLVFSSAIWIFTNLLADLSKSEISALYWSKATLIGPVLIAYFLYIFSEVFPKESQISKFYKWTVSLVTILFLVLTPTAFNVSKVQLVEGGVPGITPGPVYIPFLIYFACIMFLAFRNVLYKYKDSDAVEKKQIIFVLLGIGMSAILGLVADLILPLLDISNFVNLGPYFSIIMIIMISYAILKHHLFSIKVIATELITFAIWVFLIVQTFLANTLLEQITDGALLIIMLVFGTLLIKSVIKEVEQREQLQVLNIQLQDLVKQRESLMHLINHKVKGAFTHSKYIFAGMLDGTFGQISDDIKKWAAVGLQSDDTGIKTIDLVLNAANMQKGVIKYEMKPVDFKNLVHEVLGEKKVAIEKKGLKLENDIHEGEYEVLGDAFWLKEVINNLVENSFRYTKVGSIKVVLERKDKILLSVKDTGVGITPEDKINLFTEGGRGKDSVKVNTESTGYGLYTVKLIVEAHGGKVWAESEGEGKGSQFYVELPAQS